MRYWSFFALLLLPLGIIVGAERITPSCQFSPGAVNGVLIERDSGQLAVYGWAAKDAGRIERVLLVHGRRDIVWKARSLVDAGVAAVAPMGAQDWLQTPGEFWNRFTTARFHDYKQRTTKVPATSLKIAQWVKPGDRFTWRGLTFEVLGTPGYTREAASYLVELDGKHIAFTGDLIYGDGQILDLYSFQDAIPTAKIGGYHGYGARLADLVMSLRRIQSNKPDIIVPARGPVIRDPAAAIQRLIDRVQALYHNYLSTNALHWYFKKDRMETAGRRVLGDDADIELMPYCQHEKTPEWVREFSTSRLLISETKAAFLLDCGNQRAIDTIRDLMAEGVVKKVDGIFVTHYHDDHTNMVPAAAEAFACPVYATVEYADVLEHPERYHLPCLTANPVAKLTAVKSGHQMQWNEFTLTFYYFPGQTAYHGALLVQKPNERAILFIGDSFAPSGIDDYCVLNRNLLHEDQGYLRCFDMLHQLKTPYWLVNEHIPYVFSFSDTELKYLEQRYRNRIRMLAELFPWDDPNYGIDEQWAVFYPHGSTLASNERKTLEVRIANHSPIRRTFEIMPHVPAGFKLITSPASLTLEPRTKGVANITIQSGSQPGNALITADIRSDGMPFQDWIEALVTVTTTKPDD